MNTLQFNPIEPVACFSVLAHPEPGVLPRVLELFAKRGLVPGHVLVNHNGAGQLSIEIRMNGMDQSLAVYIGECLRGIFTVDQVLVSELRRMDVA